MSLGVVSIATDAYGQYTLISETASHTPANGRSGAAAISGDGRYVALASAATNLVAGDTNNSWDVFVKDRQTGAVARVSVASDGTERAGDSGRFSVDISHDGQIIMFLSNAALAADDTNQCVPNAPDYCQDVYVHDRATGQTTRVNVASDGTQADRVTDSPSLSPDGRFVAFMSFAKTLVANDTNDSADVFLHDRSTHATTRVSVSSSGAQADWGGGQPAVANGGIVVFTSASTTLSNESDGPPCVVGPPCVGMRAYIHTPATGTTERVVLDSVSGPSFVTSVDIDASGRWIAVRHTSYSSPSPPYAEHMRLYDHVTRRTTRVDELTTVQGVIVHDPSISGNGRVVWTHAYPSSDSLLFDRVSGLTTRPRTTCCYVSDLTLSFDGQTAAFTTSQSNLVPGVSGFHVYAYSRDADRDAIADDWEAAFGFDATSAADAALDSDGDGLTTFQEYEAGSHPNGTARRYLAEGAVNAFFTTELALFNPGETPTAAVLRFLGPDGLASSLTQTLAAHARLTIRLEPTSNIPANDFSTVVESAVPIIIDRTMTWDGTGFGSHAETAIAAPGTTWYLAEGATHGAFDLFYLLQNPNDDDANVTIAYLRPAPRAPVVKSYVVSANSRRTIWVDVEDAALEADDLAAKIDADRPIVVERAMYASSQGLPFSAGHAGAGIAAPALQWFLAEGATGTFFDLYVLVANPAASDAEIKVTYLLPAGEPIVKTYTVRAMSRLTISVEGEDPRLADTAVATIIESTNHQPVVVERAMWWPGGIWHEAHLAAGATMTGTAWALAAGGDHPERGEETYILIANTGATPGTATVTFHVEGGQAHQEIVELPGNSRVNVRPGTIPTLTGKNFGTIVESSGVPIVVERAMYTTSGGIVWAAGTCALATRLR